MNKLLLLIYFYLVLQMSVVWIIYRLVKNPSIVDVSWPLGLMITGLIYLWTQPITLRITIVSSLLIIWSLRLASYLWLTRIRKRHVDKRYVQLSDNWKISKSLGFFLNFQLQAILIFIVSIVFLFIGISQEPDFSLLDILACCVVIVGIIGESIADFQLQYFKSHHKNEVCSIGLWRYSRHPNYFFDWLTWCGFTLFSLHSAYGWIGVLSPLTLYVIFNYITGPMTERGSVKAKGQAFIAYQKKTPIFFPRFKL